MKSSIQEYLEKMVRIQNSLLCYLENEDNIEENLQNLQNLLNDHKIQDNKNEMNMFFSLLVRIANNHHSGQHFFDKIFHLLQILKKPMMQLFSSKEIFNIFKSNRKLILYFINEKIIQIERYVGLKIYSLHEFEDNLDKFFIPEIKPYILKQIVSNIEKNLPPNFEEKRKVGENENEICHLIREDLIDEFINFVQRTNIQLTNEQIYRSIFETNYFLIQKYQYSLIEYAAFFGSIKIFKYLSLYIPLTPSVWMYAIHGNNLEIIKILMEKHIEPEDKTYKKCLKEALKCHHIQIVNYILNDILHENNDIIRSFNYKCLKYHNFSFIDYELIDKSCFNELVNLGYFNLVNILLKNCYIDVNQKSISIILLIYIVLSLLFLTKLKSDV